MIKGEKNMTGWKKYLSLTFKSIVVISSFLGSLLACLSSGKFMTGGQVLLYFTIQSNIWIGLLCLFEAIMLLTNKVSNNLMKELKFIFTVSISLTGLVFCFILAPTMTNAFTFSNVLTHVVCPLFAIIDFIFVIDTKYPRKSPLFATIPPLYYLAFASIGYIAKWDFGSGAHFPYFFLNWGSPAGAFGVTKELPFLGVFYWILIMIVLVLGIAYLLRLLVSLKLKFTHSV